MELPSGDITTLINVFAREEMEEQAEAEDKGEWRLMCLHWQREQRMRNRTAAAKAVGDRPVSLFV